MLPERHSSPRRRMYAGSRIVCEETSPDRMHTSFTTGKLFDHALPVIYAPLSNHDVVQQTPGQSTSLFKKRMTTLARSRFPPCGRITFQIRYVTKWTISPKASAFDGGGGGGGRWYENGQGRCQIPQGGFCAKIGYTQRQGRRQGRVDPKSSEKHCSFGATYPSSAIVQYSKQ